MDFRKNETDYRKMIQLLFLIAAGIVLLPFVIVDGFYPGMGYFFAEKFLAVPCLLFFGSALTQRLSLTAKKCMLLSAVTVLWFVAAQMQHHLSGMGIGNFGVFAVVYLLAFPFAAVTEDGEKNLGFKWIAGIYVAFSMVMVLFAGMLLLDVVPEALDFVYWDGARAALMWHPNVSGCVMMLAVGLSLYFLTQAEKKWQICMLGIMIVLQFITLVLTNSRTAIIMTCALIGGTVFFKVWKGSVKQFLIVAGAAVAVILALLVGYNALYNLHTESQINKLMEQTEQEDGGADSTTQHLRVNSETGEVTIYGNSGSGQGKLSTDIKHLNGRTSIWRAAITALRDNPTTRLWGTEYVGLEISFRNSFKVTHAHNSWLQIAMQLGIPGFLLAMVYTVIAIWNLWALLWRKNVELSKKVVALLVVCILGASFLEAYLFSGDVYTSFVNFLFFLCTGYLVQWNRLASGKE